ncbi:hypothetical protein [Hansschlegelia zhihuaiae]|uniref:Uncharacterized protein n=1 Tax=Hansschlegelia zhihuaiae TaxID=405005 RepID=A0A4V1KJR0_9HYPH|nr:hypothetical protein [Hansschlegelia zhihuaiae]RXF75062.1 hypothetical protein EK403_03165 [Hansschlegelia zhihuaiae]
MSYPEPPVPENLAAYVDAMGRQLAVRFLLRFGGGYLALSANPRSGSPVVELIGERAARALFERLSARSGRSQVRVPTDRRWIARQMKSDKASTSEIARTLHVSDVTVRKYLGDADPEGLRAALRARQLRLF